MNQCSENFLEVFNSGCGGIVRRCACGKTYYNFMDQVDFDEDEFEELDRYSKVFPESYIAVDHTVGTMNIDGREIVIGCTCDTAARYEKFILNHINMLVAYIRGHAQSLREQADDLEIKT